MKSPLSTLRTLINLHDGKADGGDGITAGDWAEARAVANAPEPTVGVPELLETIEALFGELNSAVYSMSSLHAIQRVEKVLDKARATVARAEAHAVANAPEPDLAASSRS